MRKPKFIAGGELPSGVCPGCGRSRILSIAFEGGAQRIYVCGSDCWQEHFSDKFGPLESRTGDERRGTIGERRRRIRRTELPAIQSERIHYTAKARTSYPIPAGFRIIAEPNAVIAVGDMTWQYDKFEYVGADEIGVSADVFKCPIRSVAGTVFDLPRRGPGLAIGWDPASPEGDRESRVYVVSPEFYEAAQDVATLFIIEGDESVGFLNAVARLAELSGQQMPIDKTPDRSGDK